jgi:hypothetical protein
MSVRPPGLALLASAVLLGACAGVPDPPTRERERTLGVLETGPEYKDLRELIVPVEGPRADSIYTLELAFIRHLESDCVDIHVATNWVSREHAKTGYLDDGRDECRFSGLWIDFWRTAEVMWSALHLGRQFGPAPRSKRKLGQPRSREGMMILSKNAFVIREWASANSAGAQICGVDFELTKAQKARILDFLAEPPVPTQPTRDDPCEGWMFESEW